jgi:ABC-type multidrug transport system ATPase subunit
MRTLCAFSAVDVTAGGRPILRQVNLAIESGKRVMVVGNNGAGKSTLVRLLLGLQPSTSGEVTLFGGPPSRYRLLPHCSLVGDLKSDSDGFSLPSGRTVGDVAALYRYLHSATLHAEAQEYFINLGLDSLEKQKIASLSSGERKKLMFYLALAKQPRLLLADEPMANLDQPTRNQILAVLTSYAASAPDFAFLWITHDPAEIRDLANATWTIAGQSVSTVSTPHA